ncbi:MAG: WD40/YVTN/BNR-like repeat-containing protein, partial [Nitrospiraceae bacterium]
MMKDARIGAALKPSGSLRVTFALCLFTFYMLGLVGPAKAQQAAPSIQTLTTVGPQTVYAGSFGMGLFRSDDRGGSWTSANHGLSDPFILCLATAHDGTVYAGTFRGGVFRSQDAGNTWQPVNTGLKRLEIKSLLIRHGVVYAGTGDGLYRLVEGAAEWSVVTKGLDETLVHSIAMASDQTLYVGTSGKGVFRYKPSGHSKGVEWQRLSRGLVDHEGLIENFIRVLAIDQEQALYAGTFDGGVFRSGDAGVTWRPISRALPNDSIRGIVTNEKGLFVATGRGVFRTQNQGGMWM